MSFHISGVGWCGLVERARGAGVRGAGDCEGSVREWEGCGRELGAEWVGKGGGSGEHTRSPDDEGMS